MPTSRLCGWVHVFWLLALAVVPAARGGVEIDRSRYLSPDELRPGMKGFGRTVMSGTQIDTFDIEVVSVMRNAWFAKKDVILVRCSGLKLEHTGIIGGMSGSPCYVKGEDGEARMIGAVAYGWSFNKDPICGVQPITQMLEVQAARDPEGSKAANGSPPKKAPGNERGASGRGMGLAQIVAGVRHERIPEASRFSVFNEAIARAQASQPADGPSEVEPLVRLRTPVMVSGVSERTMPELRNLFAATGFEPVASGGASEAATAAAEGVRLEPGSVLCVTLMTGDIQMEGLGTCTEVIGDRILGFGHAMFGEGRVRLPLATGMVHTVIPSVMRSNKMGAALRTVGTLMGDETSSVFGVTGTPPRMVPLDVVVDDDRGRRTYHYELAEHEFFTAQLANIGVMESLYANHDPPREHTVRYAVETAFSGLGTFRSRDVTSQEGMMGVSFDALLPILTMMNLPFGEEEVHVERCRVEVAVEAAAHVARIEDATLEGTRYKPGETAAVRVTWRHEWQEPIQTRARYEFPLPADLPDGTYQITVGSALTHLMALQSEKRHLFEVNNRKEALEGLNLIASFPQNRVYLRMALPDGGLAVKKLEMPQLPSFREQLLKDTGRGDVQPFTRTLVQQYETEFVVGGSRTMTLTVSRRADQ